MIKSGFHLSNNSQLSNDTTNAPAYCIHALIHIIGREHEKQLTTMSCEGIKAKGIANRAERGDIYAAFTKPVIK